MGGHIMLDVAPNGILSSCSTILLLIIFLPEITWKTCIFSFTIYQGHTNCNHISHTLFINVYQQTGDPSPASLWITSNAWNTWWPVRTVIWIKICQMAVASDNGALWVCLCLSMLITVQGFLGSYGNNLKKRFVPGILQAVFNSSKTY